MSAAPSVRAITAADRPAVAGLVAELWGSPIAVAHGTVFTPATLPGVLAERDDRAVGLVTWTVAGETLEVVTIDAFPGGAGTGTALLEAAAEAARAAGCRRVVLTTTNDNVDALRFYQRRGFQLVALRPGAVDEARARHKPAIPAIGAHGIPLRDELDLEMTV